MALRSVLRRVLLLTVGLASMAVPGTVLADEVKKTPQTAEQIRAALDQKMTLDFSSQHLDEALNHLQDKTRVDFVLDTLVLQQLGIGPPNEMPTAVRLKTDGGRVRAALQRMLEPFHLSYVILGDRVLVTTEDVAQYRQMRQRVSVEAKNVPVGEVLQKLARQTAVNLVIDWRSSEKVKLEITFEQDDITLETAVRLLAFMVDLRAVPVGNVLLVTTEERAEKLMKQAETPRPPLIGGGPEVIEVPGPRRKGEPLFGDPEPRPPQPLPELSPRGKSSTAGPPAREPTDEKCCQVDHRTPVLPPLKGGKPQLCANPPDHAAIVRALPPVFSVPRLYEVARDDIDIAVEKLVDRVDPPRFYPLVGPAQLHHCHYKCTVYYTETVRSSTPFAFSCQRRRMEIIYIDRDHLHLVDEPEASPVFNKAASD